MFGWTGRIIDIDLSTKKARSRDLDRDLAIRFLGGRGFNSKVLFDRIRPDKDPLGPDNVYCIAPGSPSGTALGMTSRVEVSTLSPYFGILGDGNAGERFATVMKYVRADPDTFRELARQDRQFFVSDSFQQTVMNRYGSHYGLLNWHPGYRNYSKFLEPGEVPIQLRPESWKQYETGRTGCGNCSVRGKNVYEIPFGPRKGERGAAMEYESIFCMGTNCGVTDPVAIMEMSNLADLYGLDGIAQGNTLALARDLFASGLLTTDRIYTREKAVNARMGITSAHDTIPLNPEFFSQEDKQREETLHRQMLKRYYGALGQDAETGMPTAARMAALDLVAKDERLHSEEPYPVWTAPPGHDLNFYPHGGSRV